MWVTACDDRILRAARSSSTGLMAFFTATGVPGAAVYYSYLSCPPIACGNGAAHSNQMEAVTLAKRRLVATHGELWNPAMFDGIRLAPRWSKSIECTMWFRRPLALSLANISCSKHFVKHHEHHQQVERTTTTTVIATICSYTTLLLPPSFMVHVVFLSPPCLLLPLSFPRFLIPVFFFPAASGTST